MAGNRNKRKNPYVACDRCVAVRKALESHDFKAYCEALGITQQVQEAETELAKHPELDAQTSLIGTEDPSLIDNETAKLYGTHQWYLETQSDFINGTLLQKDGNCPFNWNPPLNRAIRVQYKLHCYSCSHEFSCPADRIPKTVYCAECYSNWNSDDYGEDC